jgi:hypothetical protein
MAYRAATDWMFKGLAHPSSNTEPLRNPTAIKAVTGVLLQVERGV